MRRKRHRPKPEHRMYAALRPHNNKLRVSHARRRTEPPHKIGGEERRVGGDSDDEAAFRPVRLRPCEPSMDAGKRAHLASEAVRQQRQSKCPKRAGSSLALSTISVTCGRRRATTWASNGRPPSGSSALSPPPMRLDLPPASTMPITPPDELMAVIVPRRGLHRLRRARRSARRAQAGGSAAT